MTTILTLPIENPGWTDTDDRLLSHVSQARQKRILRYHFAADQKLSLYAALLTRMQLSLHTGIPANDLIFETMEHKKPYVVNAADTHFNFSHTKSCILLGISDQPIGVDVETIHQDAPYEIMKSFCHPNETNYINQADTSQEKAIRFYQIWTQKEALTKYQGTGLINHLTSLDTLEESCRPYFHIWTNDSYAFSVFSKAGTPKFLTISEDTVQKYYLE